MSGIFKLIIMYLILFIITKKLEKRNKATHENINDAIVLLVAFNMIRPRIFCNSGWNGLIEYNKYFFSTKTGIALKPEYKKYILYVIKEYSKEAKTNNIKEILEVTNKIRESRSTQYELHM